MFVTLQNRFVIKLGERDLGFSSKDLIWDSFEISFLLNSSEDPSFDKLEDLIQDYLLSL